MLINLKSLENKPKAISFDWDGTLAITNNLIVEAINTVLIKRNMPNYQEMRKKRDKNKSFKENFPIFFGDDYKNAYAEYLSYYSDNCVKAVKSFAGAYVLLKRIVDSNVDIFIISNKEKSILLDEVKVCFPDIKFRDILGNGDTANNKPSPEPLIKAYKQISDDITPINFWHIGDGLPDFCSALSANALPIIVHNMDFSEDVIKFSNLDEIMKNLKWLKII